MTKGSIASKKGISVGDELVSINGNKVFCSTNSNRLQPCSDIGRVVRFVIKITWRKIICALNKQKLKSTTMVETQMILREALQTPIGAKLKFSQFGFIPTQNAKDWIKIPNYHFKTKEKVIFVIFNGNHINQKLHHFYIRIFLTGKTPYLTGVKISVNKKCSCSLLYKELVVHSEYAFR